MLNQFIIDNDENQNNKITFNIPEIFDKNGGIHHLIDHQFSLLDTQFKGAHSVGGGYYSHDTITKSQSGVYECNLITKSNDKVGSITVKHNAVNNTIEMTIDSQNKGVQNNKELYDSKQLQKELYESILLPIQRESRDPEAILKSIQLYRIEEFLDQNTNLDMPRVARNLQKLGIKSNDVSGMLLGSDVSDQLRNLSKALENAETKKGKIKGGFRSFWHKITSNRDDNLEEFKTSLQNIQNGQFDKVDNSLTLFHKAFVDLPSKVDGKYVEVDGYKNPLLQEEYYHNNPKTGKYDQNSENIFAQPENTKITQSVLEESMKILKGPLAQINPSQDQRQNEPFDKVDDSLKNIPKNLRKGEVYYNENLKDKATSELLSSEITSLAKENSTKDLKSLQINKTLQFMRPKDNVDIPRIAKHLKKLGIKSADLLQMPLQGTGEDLKVKDLSKALKNAETIKGQIKGGFSSLWHKRTSNRDHKLEAFKQSLQNIQNAPTDKEIQQSREKQSLKKPSQSIGPS